MNIGDKVLTSKGNFGKITSIKGDLAKVKIGHSEYEIEVINLTPITDTQIINVKYIKNNATCKTAIVVEKGTIIFDINNPNILENYIMDRIGECIIKTIYF